MRWPWSKRAAEVREDLGHAIGGRAIEIASGRDTDMRRLSVAEACAGVYSRCLAAATVEGTSLLTPDVLGMIGRALLFRGEFTAAIAADGYLIPCSSTDVIGRSPDPMRWGYRLQMNTPHGTLTQLAPAEAVLHVRIGAGPAAPWRGRSPLAGALADGELALRCADAIKDEASFRPITWATRKADDGGLGLPPEQVGEIADSFRAVPAGRVAVFPGALESGTIHPEPEGALNDARRTSSGEIASAAGVPRVLLDGTGDGAAQREAYRRLTRSTIEPLGRILAAEASLKLGADVAVTFQALRASDTAMAARAFAALVSNGVSAADALAIAGLGDER